MSKRVDLYLDTAQVSKYYVHEANLQDKIKVSQPINKPIHEFIGFSPALSKSKELVQIFDKRVEEMKKDGTYDKIVKAYGL